MHTVLSKLRAAWPLALTMITGTFALGGCEPMPPEDETGGAPTETGHQPLFVKQSATYGGVRTVEVCWMFDGFETEKAWVRSAIEETWQKESGVTFSKWNRCFETSEAAPTIRIKRVDADGDNPHTLGLGDGLVYLNVTFKNWSPSCSANEPTRRNCTRSVAIHEFGHLLGFAHERNRPDSPPGVPCNTQGSNGDVLVGPWDPDSVMNYCNTARWSNGSPLGPTDIQGIRQFYGRPVQHVAAATADGHLLHAMAELNGGFSGWGDVENEVGDMGKVHSLDSTANGQHLYVAGVNDAGELRLAIRHEGGSWQANERIGDRIVDVGVTTLHGFHRPFLQTDTMQQHFCAVRDDGGMVHRYRAKVAPNGLRWQDWGDVKAQAGNPGRFVRVDCAGFDNELHVVGLTDDGRMWHTIRRAGRWTQFGSLSAEVGAGAVFDISLSVDTLAGDSGAPGLSVNLVGAAGAHHQVVRHPSGFWAWGPTPDWSGGITRTASMRFRNEIHTVNLQASGGALPFFRRDEGGTVHGLGDIQSQTGRWVLSDVTLAAGSVR